MIRLISFVVIFKFMSLTGKITKRALRKHTFRTARIEDKLGILMASESGGFYLKLNNGENYIIRDGDIISIRYGPGGYFIRTGRAVRYGQKNMSL